MGCGGSLVQGAAYANLESHKEKLSKPDDEKTVGEALEDSYEAPPPPTLPATTQLARRNSLRGGSKDSKGGQRRSLMIQRSFSVACMCDDEDANCTEKPVEKAADEPIQEEEEAPKKVEPEFDVEGLAQFCHCLSLRQKYKRLTPPTKAANLGEGKFEVVMLDGIMELPGLDFPEVPSRLEFQSDLSKLWTHVKSPELKSIAMDRLTRLSAQYKSYTLDHADFERDDLAALEPDLFSVTKVDNHVHLAAAMPPRLLLDFIKEKFRTEPEREVAPGKTLRQIIADALGIVGDAVKTITETDMLRKIGMDTLRCCADEHFYHRFDTFNNAYNPLGCELLRSVFLKTTNHIGGEYFGEISRRIIDGLDRNNTLAEMRLSIYGNSMSEWDKLAKWMTANKLHTGKPVTRNLWMVQIPRVYSVFRGAGKVGNFEELLTNIFQPLFETAVDPSSHPEVAEVLSSIIGFDCVDDESRPDPMIVRRSQLYGDKVARVVEQGDEDILRPQLWTVKENPPYSYYCFYLYVNLRRFNDLCKMFGRPWELSFRPHCGEAGEVHHLATAFLLADGINHGIQLEHSPMLQYLYMVTQIGVSSSPISNNHLFLKLQENPFPAFFHRGLNVTLSTDDPLMFHATDEPLLEEYTVSRHVYGLTFTDLYEIAANSVRQSGFPLEVKHAALGRHGLSSPFAWDPQRCNVPLRRLRFRRGRLADELDFLNRGAPFAAIPDEPNVDPHWHNHEF